MFHLARLYCCWNSRTVSFFHAVTSVGQESLILYKGFADNHLAKNVGCAYDLSIWLIHVSQSIVSMRNYHTMDAAITVLVCSQLKVTRSGAMKQSEVTHIVMQWRGFFFFYLWVSFSIYPFCLLQFLLLLPPPCTLSVSCTVGEDVCRCPGGGGGEINSEGVWSFLKDFPGKTLLSGW